MPHETPKSLSALDAPDEITCRRLLALLASGGAADADAA